MNVFSTTPFDLTGEYGGFHFTPLGKRRLLLRVEGGEYLLKVPRTMRRRVDAIYRKGQPIRLTGSEERDLAGQVFRRVVDNVVPLSGAPAAIAAPRDAGGPIRVCTKKNCWRSGGRELWSALEREVSTRGLGGQVEIKGVGCMDRCRMAPNAEWQGCTYRACSPADAPAMVARAAGDASETPVGSEWVRPSTK